MIRVRNLVSKSSQLQRLAARPLAAASKQSNVALHSAQRREMCGLVAAIDDIWSVRAAGTQRGAIPILDDREALRQTTRILDHRGPDGYEISTGTVGGEADSVNHARWSMGHTRLAIVDPSNRFADMPFNLKFRTGAEGSGKNCPSRSQRRNL